MYAAIRRYRTPDIQELARRVQEEFVDMIGDVPGFVGYYVVDGGDGNVASITVCEDRAGVDESTRRAAAWVNDRVSDLIEGGPDVMAGEVVASH